MQVAKNFIAASNPHNIMCQRKFLAPGPVLEV